MNPTQSNAPTLILAQTQGMHKCENYIHQELKRNKIYTAFIQNAPMTFGLR